MSATIQSALPSLTQLAKTYLIQLDHFSAISLRGDERTKYLQGQITADVNQTSTSSLQHGAHCDAKGKVFSAFRLFNRDKAHMLIQPKASIVASLAELKKFGVFSKVTIEQESDLSFYALVGDQAAELLAQHFDQVPDSLTPVIQIDSTNLIYIGGNIPRYLVVDKPENIAAIIEKLSLPLYDYKVWQLLEINQGFPILSNETSGQYVPQMLNLQAINGISFTKGCYLGQETVARMQYLGKNKRALFYLEAKLDKPLHADDIIEKQLGENWRKAGDILASYQADDGTCYVQAVLSNEETEHTLRIKSQPESLLEVKELPYSLVSEKPD